MPEQPQVPQVPAMFQDAITVLPGVAEGAVHNQVLYPGQVQQPAPVAPAPQQPLGQVPSLPGEAAPQQPPSPAPAPSAPAPAQQPPAQPPVEQVQAQPEQPKQEKPPGFEEFAKQFQEYMGIDLKDAVSTYQQAQQFQAQQVEQQGIAQMAERWGVDMNEANRRYGILSQHKAQLAQTDPAYAASLNSVEAALGLWDYGLTAEQKGIPSPVSAPGFDMGTRQVAAGDPGYDFTRAQIHAMSPDEKRLKWGAIQQAYATGRVR